MMQLKWYILKVQQQAEEKTADLIEAAFKKKKIAQYLGRMRVVFDRTYVVEKGKHQVKKGFFGYLLAELDIDAPRVKDTLLEVKNVKGFLGDEGRTRMGDPIPVPEAQVTHMLSGREKKQTITESIAGQFCVGDEVNIIDGPFKGRKGTIHKLDNENNKVELILELFRQDTIVSFNYNQIQ